MTEQTSAPVYTRAAPPRARRRGASAAIDGRACVIARTRRALACSFFEKRNGDYAKANVAASRAAGPGAGGVSKNYEFTKDEDF